MFDPTEKLLLNIAIRATSTYFVLDKLPLLDGLQLVS